MIDALPLPQSLNVIGGPPDWGIGRDDPPVRAAAQSDHALQQEGRL